MAKNLPKKLFVFKENEGTRDEFMYIAVTPDDIHVANGEIRVGIYKLEKVVTAVNKTEILEN